MPVDNHIGHSDWTEQKETSLACLLSQHIAIVERVWANNSWAARQYIFIDLFAGSGINEEEKCDGSPIVFLNAIKGKIPYFGHFVEKERDNFCRLAGTVGLMSKSHLCYHGDNIGKIVEILKGVPSNAFGLVYADPNYVAESDIELLKLVSQSRQRLDILIRYAAAAGKRNGRDLRKEIDSIGKSHWIVQKPHGRWQWTFLFGTNYNDYKAWRSKGFYDWKSDEGRDIFRQLNYTHAELEAMVQPSFFDPTPREQAIERSGGICERCKENPVEQVHHLSYKPPETAEKLVAL